MATPAAKMEDTGIGHAVKVSWAAGATGETGAGAFVGDMKLLSAQAVGDATTVSIEGSNDGTNWAALATPVTLTIAAGKTPVTRILENAAYLRPNITGGTSTVVTINGMRDY